MGHTEKRSRTSLHKSKKQCACYSATERRVDRKPFSAPSEGRWKHKYPSQKGEKQMKLASKYNIVAVLLVLLAWSANCTRMCMAADYTKVGVKVGDTADYETSVSYVDYNRTHMLVYGIIGTVITANFTDYNRDGTVNKTWQIAGDISIGAYPMFLYFTAANLTAGDPSYAGSTWTINETITMTVAGIPRTVNHIRLPDGSFEAYWDKATGLMTKLNAFVIIYWYNYTMISTDAWSIVTPPPPPPVAPAFSVKLSGEFDYGNKENTYVRLAALVKDYNTSKPVSGANIIIQIYYPNGTLWISGVMLEKLVGTGIYEWESYNKIVNMKLAEGVYLVHVKAFPGGDPTGSDMLLFHIDPPPESGDPSSATMSHYIASTVVLAAGTIVGVFLIRRHKRLQAETANAMKPPNK